MAVTAMDFIKSDPSEKESPDVYVPDKSDLEAAKSPTITTERRFSAREDDVAYGTTEEVQRTIEIQHSFGPLRSLRKGEEWMDAKMGIESKGIDRVPEEEKKPPSMWNVFLFWWSLNIHVGVLPIGMLGSELDLSLKQTIAAGIVGNVLGCFCTAFDGTLSPKLGLRQIAVSRYSFGFWGAKLCSVLNIIVGGGFMVVNLVVVGQILSAVSDYKMTITVGIVVIAVVSYLVSVFGFAMIHTFEKYSWIVTFILLLVLVGQVAPHVVTDAPGKDPGISGVGAFLSMLALTFSNAAAWCSIAGDYYVHFPANTPRWKIFSLTYWGVLIPLTFSVVVGALLGNAANTAAYPPYADAYENHGLGGLIREVYHPLGWSKFCLVILTFSVLGNNIAVNYSSGLSIQLLGHWFHAVPRLIWSFLFAVVVAVIAIAGQTRLSTIVLNFVSLLGYWAVSFTVILFVEDQYFRRKTGYDLLVWDSPKALPWGVAATTALLAGYLAGGLPGMAQTWYVGPIAAKFSQAGGDVGVYMSFAITLVWYIPARVLEKKLEKRYNKRSGELTDVLPVEQVVGS